MSKHKFEKILLTQEYDLNFFKKYISLVIDTSKGKRLIRKTKRFYKKALMFISKIKDS